jgi:hypothetical protein
VTRLTSIAADVFLSSHRSYFFFRLLICWSHCLNFYEKENVVLLMSSRTQIIWNLQWFNWRFFIFMVVWKQFAFSMNSALNFIS